MPPDPGYLIRHSKMEFREGLERTISKKAARASVLWRASHITCILARSCLAGICHDPILCLVLEGVHCPLPFCNGPASFRREDIVFILFVGRIVAGYRT